MTDEEIRRDLVGMMKGDWDKVSPVFNPFILPTEERALIRSHYRQLWPGAQEKIAGALANKLGLGVEGFYVDPYRLAMVMSTDQRGSSQAVRIFSSLRDNETAKIEDVRICEPLMTLNKVGGIVAPGENSENEDKFRGFCSTVAKYIGERHAVVVVEQASGALRDHSSAKDLLSAHPKLIAHTSATRDECFYAMQKLFLGCTLDALSFAMLLIAAQVTLEETVVYGGKPEVFLWTGDFGET